MIRSAALLALWASLTATNDSNIYAFAFAPITSKNRVSAWSLPEASESTSRLLYSNNEDGDGTRSDESGASNDPFMTSLKARMDQVNDRDTKLPIIVMDTMLPRQTLKIENNDPAFKLLIQTLLNQENPSFGVIGFAPVRVGPESQMVPLQNGVEVQIVGQPIVTFDETQAATTNPTEAFKNEYLRVELKAGRRFRISGEATQNEAGGWTEARVTFVNSQDEEAAEVVPGLEPLSLDRARRVSTEFTEPEPSSGQSPVERWIALAKTHERTPGQIDALLEDIGPIPPVDQPTERAFWVGALINPLPGMGVAMEIRPMLLMLRTAEERTRIAMNGMQASIKHMDGTQYLF